MQNTNSNFINEKIIPPITELLKSVLTIFIIISCLMLGVISITELASRDSFETFLRQQIELRQSEFLNAIKQDGLSSKSALSDSEQASSSFVDIARDGRFYSEIDELKHYLRMTQILASLGAKTEIQTLDGIRNKYENYRATKDNWEAQTIQKNKQITASEIEKNNNKIDSLNKKISDISAKNQSINNQLQLLNSEKSKFTDDLTSYDEKINKLSLEFAVAEKDYKASNSALKTADQVYEKAKINFENNENSENKKALADAKKEAGEAYNLLMVNEKTHDSLQKEINSLKSNKTEISSKIKRLDLEINTHKSSIDNSSIPQLLKEKLELDDKNKKLLENNKKNDDRLREIQSNATYQSQKIEQNLLNVDNEVAHSSIKLSQPHNNVSENSTGLLTSFREINKLPFIQSNYLLALAVIASSTLGAMVAGLRGKGSWSSIRDVILGAASGFICYIAIKGGKYVFLLSVQNDMVSFNPYGAAFAGLLVGLFSERAYRLLELLVGDLEVRIQSALKNEPKK